MTKKKFNVKGEDKPVEFDNIFDSVTDNKAEAEILKIESDRLLKDQMNSTEKIFLLAIELFEGNEEKARNWFDKPNRALNGTSPVERVQIEGGETAVTDLIGRLEHGIFS